MSEIPQDAKDAASLISPELLAELGGNESVILLPKKKKKGEQGEKKREREEVLEEARALSKSKQKKLKLLEERKLLSLQRDKFYSSLQAHALSAPQQLLLSSSKALGQKQTLKQRLKMALERERAGLQVDEETKEKLHRVREREEDDGDQWMMKEERREPIQAPESKKKEEDKKEEDQNEEEAPVLSKAKRKRKKKNKSSLLSSSQEPQPPTAHLQTTTSQKEEREAAGLSPLTSLLPSLPPNESAAEIEGGREALNRLEELRRKNQRKRERKLAGETNTAMQEERKKETVQERAVSRQKREAQSEEKDSLSLPEPRIEQENSGLRRLRELQEKNRRKRTEKAETSLSSLEGDLMEKEEERREEKERDKLGRKEQPAYVPKPIDVHSILKPNGKERERETPAVRGNPDLQVIRRLPHIQVARMLLPICQSEQEVMESISQNDVLILCGETGSGKTTQVPQFLYEAGFGAPGSRNPGRIGVTQPRRVAAVSTAKRVAEELNVPLGREGPVGYQIRHDTQNCGAKTRIKFMTDGILLRELKSDFLLRDYSAILLDEAHERNLNTDILIGLLSRAVRLRNELAKKQRKEKEEQAVTESTTTPDGPENVERKNEEEEQLKPLKLVIMSATLRVEDFTENSSLFPHPPPVLRVDARQYPVTVHFNKRTELNDYVGEAFKKVCKIHEKLPEGGILVFLTGQNEILHLCNRLRKRYCKDQPEGEREKLRAIKRKREKREGEEKEIEVREHDDDEEEADLDDAAQTDEESDSDSGSASEGEEDEEEEERSLPPAHILPLYSLLDTPSQLRVFSPPPEGSRLIVVATNVAETSVTLPNISYVVDCGRVKERVFDVSSGVSRFEVRWISKASADQRAGRAGRVGPGHCYRLFSTAVFNDQFKKFSDPEILCLPVEDVVLQMKSLGIQNVLRFPFPTPPEPSAVRTAVQLLKYLGALDPQERLTNIGRAVAQFPLSARYGKMLLLGKENSCLQYTIALVAALSSLPPFLRPSNNQEQDPEEEKEKEDDGQQSKAKERDHPILQLWRHPESDALSLLRAMGAYAFSSGDPDFCRTHLLHEKTMDQNHQLREQLTRIANRVYEGEEGFTPLKVERNMAPPSREEEYLLRQIVAAGLVDQVARKVPPGTIKEGSKFARHCAYQSSNPNIREFLYIHPHSFLFSDNPHSLPEFLVFQTAVKTKNLLYMKGVTAIKAEWLPIVTQGSSLCRLSKPLENPPPEFDKKLDCVMCYVTPRFGAQDWELPTLRIPFQDSGGEESEEREREMYRYFARLLLEGKVLSSWAALLLPLLKEKPVSIFKKKYGTEQLSLSQKLREREVCSSSSLKSEWETDPDYLFPEIKKIVKADRQKDFEKLWKKLKQG